MRVVYLLAGSLLGIQIPLRDTHPLIMLAEDAVSNAMPRLLRVDDRDIEAVEELEKPSAIQYSQSVNILETQNNREQ